MRNAANMNNDLHKTDTRDVYIKNTIASTVRELTHQSPIPFINLAVFFNNTTATLPIDKTNEFYTHLMMCFVKSRWQNENIPSIKKETFVSHIWEKIGNNDKNAFLLIIRDNALDKLAYQLNESTDHFKSLRLVQDCHFSYAIFNSPPLKQHPMIAFQLRNLMDKYSKLCLPLLRAINI